MRGARCGVPGAAHQLARGQHGGGSVFDGADVGSAVKLLHAVILTSTMMQAVLGNGRHTHYNSSYTDS